MDVVLKVLDPWLSSNDYKALGSAEKGDTDEAVSGPKIEASKHSEAKVTKLPLSLSDLVREANIQLHIKRVLILSWQNSTDCKGFAFMQQRLDLQLRLIREKQERPAVAHSIGHVPQAEQKLFCTPVQDHQAQDSHASIPLVNADTIQSTHGGSLLVDHMFCEAEFADLYVRDWSLHVGENDDGETSRCRGSSSGLDSRRRFRQSSSGIESLSVFHSRISQYRSWHHEKREGVRKKAEEKRNMQELRENMPEEMSSAQASRKKLYQTRLNARMLAS